MTRPVTVYGLASSADGKIRYVGQTVQSLKTRLIQHTSAGQRKTRSHRTHWINAVITGGHRLIIWAIEENAVWHESEKRLVAWYRRNGVALVNQTDGGEGTLGFRHSGRKRPDLAARNRALAGKPGRPLTAHQKAVLLEHSLKPKPWTAERNRLGKGKSGHPHTADSRAKIGAKSKAQWTEEKRAEFGARMSGRQVSDETKSKIRAAALGRIITAETRAKISAAGRGRKWTPEQRAACMAALAANPRPPMTPEHFAKLDEARRRYWAARREARDAA